MLAKARPCLPEFQRDENLSMGSPLATLRRLLAEGHSLGLLQGSTPFSSNHLLSSSIPEVQRIHKDLCSCTWGIPNPALLGCFNLRGQKVCLAWMPTAVLDMGPGHQGTEWRSPAPGATYSKAMALLEAWPYPELLLKRFLGPTKYNN